MLCMCMCLLASLFLSNQSFKPLIKGLFDHNKDHNDVIDRGKNRNYMGEDYIPKSKSKYLLNVGEKEEFVFCLFAPIYQVPSH